MQNKIMHRIIAISTMLLVSITNYGTDIRTRSQSVDSARQLSGLNKHINLYNVGEMYGAFSITPEYTHSFQSHKIAKALFGNAISLCKKGCNAKSDASFRVSGSQAASRQVGDLLADYFGLPLDYQSTVYVKPVIQNFLVDFDLYLGLDNLLCGLWFKIHAPIVYAKWNLKLNEQRSSAGTLDYPAGYFGPAAVPVANLNTSFISYLQGNVPTIGNGVVFQPLKNSKISSSNCFSKGNATSHNNSNHTTRLSDIRMSFGWNFAQNEDYHIGLGILAAAPTGNRVNDELLFQPMVGNGHHWELGGQFTSHYTAWRGCDNNQSIDLSLDVDVTHLFATSQFRVFDLVAADDNSRYMITLPMHNYANNHLEGGLTSSSPAGPATGYIAASAQFNNIFTPLANVAAQKIKVSQPYQVDLTAMVTYNRCGLTWNTGYNFWMTGAEKFGKQCVSVFDGITEYALKGDAYVYGFDNQHTTGGSYNPVALSVSEDNATICSGTNYPVGTFTPFPSTNTYVDNARFAYGDSTGGTANNALVNVTSGATAANQTRTSIQPIFIADSDLNLTTARSKGLSHKIFTYVGYTWEDCGCYIPYFGVGGKAEFAGCVKGYPSSCASNKACGAANYFSAVCGDLSSCSDNKCRRTNISEWGLWLKGGFSF